MKTTSLALILCMAIIFVIPAQGIGFSVGFQYAFSGEEYSGYMMTYDIIGPIGAYVNFYGLGVTDRAMFEEPWPGDPLEFTIEKTYWAAQSIGLTLRILPGIYIYGGYCNGKYLSTTEYYWFDETYTFSHDGFYTTMEGERHNNPGFDMGLSISPFSYFGFNLGYNFSLDAAVIGFNTGFYF